MSHQKISKIFRIFNTSFMASKVQNISNLTTKLTNFVSMYFRTVTFVSYCSAIISNSWHSITKIVLAAKMDKNFRFFFTLADKMYENTKC